MLLEDCLCFGVACWGRVSHIDYISLQPMKSKMAAWGSVLSWKRLLEMKHRFVGYQSLLFLWTPQQC